MTFSKLGTDIDTGQFVYLPKTARTQGLYIIGIQGTGKSGLIENLIMQDIDQQIGVCVLDPHGELIEHVIARLPDKQTEDKVVFLDLANYHYPFGLNLFTCADLANPIEVQKTVDQVMHVFEKLLGVSHDTPLILQYLRNCTYALVVNPGYTMADIPLLLTDKQCRQKLVANVKKLETLTFWRDYDAMPPSEQRTERSSTLRRVEEFLQDLTKPIVGQSTTTIDLQDIMNQGGILLVKLSAQVESVSSLIGSLMIALLLNAAYNRPAQRRQFHLYADEFQRFATEDFAELLEQARKFAIATTIAHQNRGQLNSANSKLEIDLKDRSRSVGNLVVFKINSKDADDLAGEFIIKPDPGEPVLEQITKRAGELVTRVYWEPPEAEKEFEEVNNELLVDLEPKFHLLDYCFLASNGSANKDEDAQIDRDWEILSKRIFKEGRYRRDDARLIELYSTRYKGRAYIGLIMLVHVFSHRLTDEERDTVTRMLSRSLYPVYVPPFCNLPDNEHWLTFLWENIYKHAPQKYLMVDHYPKPLPEKFHVPPHEYYHLPVDIPTVLEHNITEMGHYYAGRLGEDGRLTKLAHKAVDEFLLEVTLVLRPIKAKIAYHLPPAKLNDRGKLEFLHYEPRAPVSLDFFLWVRKYVMQLDKRLIDTVEKIEQLKSCRKEKLEFVDFGYELPDREIIGYTRWGDPQEIPRYRKKPGPPRPIADVRNELANNLVGLPNFTARVKIVSNNGSVEHTIKTLEPEKGLYGKLLKERIDRIRVRNIQQGYLRERTKVEAEILQRQQSFQPVPAIAHVPQPQPAQRHARQVPVQGNCPNCGKSNPPGSTFCNQCGIKL